ncbi:hypothetical protein C4565_05010 [Candidatus Parcubacteria bacterium]|nr:MAG: hypothetical protein C4565_05010 [Candidatus Parcubacteria bacterium]
MVIYYAFFDGGLSSKKTLKNICTSAGPPADNPQSGALFGDSFWTLMMRIGFIAMHVMRRFF